MSVLRFDPFRELDRVADEAFGRPRPPVLPMDAFRRPGELVLQFDLPGVDAESIDVTVRERVLTVSAERRAGRRDGDEPVVSERPAGRVARNIRLGEGLDHQRVTAAYDAGVLTVTLPVAERNRPRRVPVERAASGSHAEAGEQPAAQPAATDPEARETEGGHGADTTVAA